MILSITFYKKGITMIEGKAVFYIPLGEDKTPKIDGVALLYAKGFDSEEDIRNAISKSGKGIVTSVEDLSAARSFDEYSIYADYSGYLLKLQSGAVRYIFHDLTLLILDMKYTKKPRLLQFAFNVPDTVFDRISIHVKEIITPKEAISASTKTDPEKIYNTVKNVLDIDKKLSNESRAIVILCNLADIVFVKEVRDMLYKKTSITAFYMFAYSESGKEHNFKEEDLLYLVSSRRHADYHDFALDKLHDTSMVWLDS